MIIFIRILKKVYVHFFSFHTLELYLFFRNNMAFVVSMSICEPPSLVKNIGKLKKKVRGNL